GESVGGPREAGVIWSWLGGGRGLAKPSQNPRPPEMGLAALMRHGEDDELARDLRSDDNVGVVPQQKLTKRELLDARNDGSSTRKASREPENTRQLRTELR